MSKPFHPAGSKEVIGYVPSVTTKGEIRIPGDIYHERFP
jgi:hypothetical protein